MKNKVDCSIEAPGGTVCVDIFHRPDGSWGFEEYRRDTEDGRGWFPIGDYGESRFETQQDAVLAAKKTVVWLKDAM
ncbi:MAG: hypothetical protein AAFP68_00530 [Pseudomonadota bacterium]